MSAKRISCVAGFRSYVFGSGIPDVEYEDKTVVVKRNERIMLRFSFDECCPSYSLLDSELLPTITKSLLLGFNNSLWIHLSKPNCFPSSTSSSSSFPSLHPELESISVVLNLIETMTSDVSMMVSVWEIFDSSKATDLLSFQTGLKIRNTNGISAVDGLEERSVASAAAALDCIGLALDRRTHIYSVKPDNVVTTKTALLYPSKKAVWDSRTEQIGPLSHCFISVKFVIVDSPVPLSTFTLVSFAPPEGLIFRPPNGGAIGFAPRDPSLATPSEFVDPGDRAEQIRRR